MTPRSQNNNPVRPSPDPLPSTQPHAAAVDIGADAHWVAVPPDYAPPPAPDHPPQLPPHVRKFGSCTADLEALAAWLKACGVTSVAMESTGVY